MSKLASEKDMNFNIANETTKSNPCLRLLYNKKQPTMITIQSAANPPAVAFIAWHSVQSHDTCVVPCHDRTRRGALQASLVALAVLGLGLAAPAQAALVSFQTEVLDQDPYSFHRFNESSGTTATDTSGNNRNGTYVGSPTLNLAGAGGTGTDNAVGLTEPINT